MFLHLKISHHLWLCNKHWFLWWKSCDYILATVDQKVKERAITMNPSNFSILRSPIGKQCNFVMHLM